MVEKRPRRPLDLPNATRIPKNQQKILASQFAWAADARKGTNEMVNLPADVLQDLVQYLGMRHIVTSSPDNANNDHGRDASSARKARKEITANYGTPQRRKRARSPSNDRGDNPGEGEGAGQLSDDDTSEAFTSWPATPADGKPVAPGSPPSSSSPLDRAVPPPSKRPRVAEEPPPSRASCDTADELEVELPAAVTIPSEPVNRAGRQPTNRDPTSRPRNADRPTNGDHGRDNHGGRTSRTPARVPAVIPCTDPDDARNDAASPRRPSGGARAEVDENVPSPPNRRRSRRERAGMADVIPSTYDSLSCKPRDLPKTAAAAAAAAAGSSATPVNPSEESRRLQPAPRSISPPFRGRHQPLFSAARRKEGGGTENIEVEETVSGPVALQVAPQTSEAPSASSTAPKVAAPMTAAPMTAAPTTKTTAAPPVPVPPTSAAAASPKRAEPSIIDDTSDPYECFTSAYKHYHGTRDQFVHAIKWLRFYRRDRLVPGFLYDDVVRVHSDEFAEYLDSLVTDELHVSLCEWYNDHIDAVMFKKGILTRQNLGIVASKLDLGPVSPPRTFPGANASMARPVEPAELGNRHPSAPRQAGARDAGSVSMSSPSPGRREVRMPSSEASAPVSSSSSGNVGGEDGSRVPGGSGRNSASPTSSGSGGRLEFQSPVVDGDGFASQVPVDGGGGPDSQVPFDSSSSGGGGGFQSQVPLDGGGFESQDPVDMPAALSGRTMQVLAPVARQGKLVAGRDRPKYSSAEDFALLLANSSRATRSRKSEPVLYPAVETTK